MDSSITTQRKWNIQTEKLRFLCINSRRGMIALLIVVPAVAFILWNEVPHSWLISWTIMMFTLTSIRLILAFKHEKNVEDVSQHQSIKMTFFITVSMAGIGLGVGSMMFASVSSPMHQAFIAFILGGITAGSVSTLSSILRVYGYYFFPCILPITIWFFIQGNIMSTTMGIMIILFISTVWNGAISYSRNLDMALQLAEEKRQLSEEMAQANVKLKHEITEREKSESDLAASEERYRMILDHAQVGISVIQDGKVAFTNPYACHTLGYTMDEMIGMSLLDVVHPDDLETSKKRMADVLINQSIHDSYQLRYLDKKGNGIYAEASAIPIIYHGKPAVLAIALNINKRIQAENEKDAIRKELEHTQRLDSLGILAGGIAHDFNNLLAAIMGNAELVRTTLPDNEKIVGHIDRIERCSMRAADLCKQMLAYAGKGKMQTGPVNLSDLVSESGELLSAAIDKKTQLKYNLTKDLPCVHADQTQMQQIIMNLITNADESLNKQGGQIHISTGITTQVQDEGLEMAVSTLMTTKDYVFIEVEDNGCGMDAVTKEKMFDPFFTTKFTGRGLGLSATLGIIKSQNGAIQISSRPEKGTRIRVLLPQMEPASSFSPSNTVEQQLTDTGTGTILIVEDEEVVREFASIMLKQMGFKTLTAEDGQQAVEVFKQHQQEINLTLMDITMPIMNGTEAFQAIRAIKTDAKVLLTSGYNEIQVEDLITNNSAVGFIQKPYSIKTMTKKLAKLLT
ncbi:MAG: PAS domain S-box protein [Mariprofundaceae bacterium]